MIRRPPRSTLDRSSAASDVYKRQALATAASLVAGPTHREAATLGGNLCQDTRCVFYNQSEWWRDAVGNCLKCDGDVCIATGGRKACFSKLASDTAPVLIAMEAQLEVVTAEGTQIIPLESIYTGDGVDPRNLPPTALIQAILLPVSYTHLTLPTSDLG